MLHEFRKRPIRAQMRSVLEVRFHILTERSKTHIQTEFSKSCVEIAQGLMTGSDMITGMIRQRPSQVSVNRMPFCGSITSKPRAWRPSNPPKNGSDSPTAKQPCVGHSAERTECWTHYRSPLRSICIVLRQSHCTYSPGWPSTWLFCCLSFPSAETAEAGHHT